MIDSKRDGRETEASGGKFPRMQYGILGAICILVIGIYAYMAQSGALEQLTPNAADAYYNLLVDGFRAGQLSLKKEVPAGFVQLADPYDPAAHLAYLSPPHRMFDLSYYKGRLYLYFGITPALMIFWPYVALTGHYLYHREAVAIFCALGFLAGAGLLRALWQRYFAEVKVGVVAACALAFGLATGLPVLLSQADIYEVVITGGYMLTMLALAAIWCALHEPERRCRWLTVASVAYGLAVGARPNLLFGAVILLVPVAQVWRERWPRRLLGLTAATVPIFVIGLGLMLYNFWRFGNPFEFGWHYELTWERQVSQQNFSLRNLWFNLRVYLLEPGRWSGRFPFIREIAIPRMPSDHGGVTAPFGVLTNIPLVWLALAVPLAWRNRPERERTTLRWFVIAVALLFGICLLTLAPFRVAAFRYQVDFLPAQVMLAVIGILGLERVLADRLVWRRAMRCGWGLLLGLSVAFNVLASSEHYAEAHYNLAVGLEQSGKVGEAMGQYEQALHLNPDLVDAHYNLGVLLAQLHRLPEAVDHWQQVVAIKPDFANAHYNLGRALIELGRVRQGIDQYEQVVRITPDDAGAHYQLGHALEQMGKPEQAIGHYEQALRIQPDYAEARDGLARLRGLGTSGQR